MRAERELRKRTTTSVFAVKSDPEGGACTATPTTGTRSAANMRERDRTQSVNHAYDQLRGLIPTEPVDRKLSKIEILRLANSYIQHLATSLQSGKHVKKSRTICKTPESISFRSR